MKGQRLHEWGLAALAPVVGILPVPIAAIATYDSEQLGQGLVTLALLLIHGVPKLLGEVFASWDLGLPAASPTMVVSLAPNAGIAASMFYLLLLVSSIVVAAAAANRLRVSRSQRGRSSRRPHH